MDEPIIIRIPLAGLYTVGFVDSAGGRVPGTNKGRSANYRSRSAIIVISQDDIDRIFIRKAWARHCTTDELCDEIFATYAEFRPATIGIDSSANQSLFANALIREAREKGKKLPLTQIALGTDKDTRIETTLQPAATAGRIFALCDMTDLRGEWEGFPGSQFKDILDALAGAIKLLPTRHTNDEVSDEVNQYREHLRRMGFNEPEIEKRVIAAFAQAEMR
jgi:predicted phage terminase large subunit-like protein